jgi:sterol O-acyltransferase
VSAAYATERQRNSIMPQAQASDVNGVVVDGSHLIGELDPDGTARFEVDSKATTAGSTSPSDEDYDHVATDPSTVLEGSHGGAVSGPSLAGRRASILAANGGTKGDATNRPRNSRRKSVPIKLQPTDIKGRYLLRADDPALEDILQRVVRGERNTKARTRFSDLVFTRQFTAFDRQNPSSGGSPFHGFFTLFWLCIVFMLVKIAANNYRATGSIFGTHELLTMMFSSETFVVCLSDVFMMSCTVFCLILQKAVHADWISWNKTGWLLQSVSLDNSTRRTRGTLT